jgi:altronate hydrolase
VFQIVFLEVIFMLALKIHPRDTVAIAVNELRKGTAVVVDAATIHLREDIPVGHKFSLCEIGAGATVIKYGYPIGVASREINVGEWVHEHNLQSNLGGIGEYSWTPSTKKPAVPSRKLTFNGYVRPDGSVGIRNELWVVPMVGCVNGIAEQIVKITRARGLPVNIENVVAFPHPFGCSQLGGDLEHTQKILAGLVKHPNAGGVLLLWLGCENNTPESFKEVLGDIDLQRVRMLCCQDAGDEIDTGVRLLSELLVY